jgi:hypothetical protein
MKKGFKSLLAIFISLCMILSIAPVSVFADIDCWVTFGTDSFNGNTAEYEIDGYHIEITVTGANIVNGAVSIPNGDFSGITFNVGGDFDSSFMRVVVCGENNYRGEPVISGPGDLIFDELVLPEGELRLEIEIDGGENGGWYEEHIIHFKDATVVDSDTVVFGSGNDAVTLDIINAELDENNDIHTFDSEEVYNIEFEISGAFDANTMHIYALALDGYVGELFIDNGTASFRNPDPDGEDLHFPTEVFISLDDYLMYAIVRDSNGNRYLDGETLKLAPGESIFLWCETHWDNASHGVFPAVGFNYGVAGEGNFADSLTSMGFTVTEGDAQTLGYASNEIDPNSFGCEVTVPNDMDIGTTARMTYSLYELPENFSWDDMWANFSWSETPIIQTNDLIVEVREPWRLYCDATVYTPGGFEKTVFDGTTLYIDRNESLFIQVNSDYEWNPRYGVTNFYSFNFNEVTDDGYHVEFCDATEKGYPDVGSGIYIEPDNNRDFINTTELCFGVHNYPENENDEMDYSNPAAKCYLNLEIREYNPCIYAVDQYGMIYNDGDSIFFDEDEIKAIAFRTDLRNADHGFYKDYIGWNTDVLENAGFTIIDEGPAFMFDDYKDDFLYDDFIFIISSENLNNGTQADFDTWLYEYVDDDDFDWATTPVAYNSTFNFKVAPLFGETGDCFWSYDIGSKTLEISGDGAMADYGFIPGANEPVPSPWNGYNIEKVVILDGVTNIGQDAFIFSNVYDVEIPDSVTSIGANAFNGCGALDFVTLPHNLVSVGNYAFAGTSLREIEIPSTVTSIGQCAFGYYYDEQAGDDVTVDGFEIYGYAETEAETYADDNGFTFHDNTVYLSQDGLWKYCIRPDGAAMLYSDVFQGYSYQGNETVVTIPSTIDGYTVKELGAFSMGGLTNVTKITVPDSVEIIGFSAFSGDTSLYELELGDNIQVIGAQTIDNTNLGANPAYHVDGGIYINDYLFRVDQNYQGCYRVTDGTKLMALFAFGNCAGINRVELPDTITSIGMAMFVGCRSLREIYIPASVTEINCNFNYYDDQLQREICPLERIYGYYGSYAEQYADENGFEFIGTATSGDTGDCTWSYDESTHTLTISGNGAMADYGMIPGANEAIITPWRNFDIGVVIVEDGVTHIGQDAFIASNVYDVDIADSVTSIGVNAFNLCGALDFVILPHNLTSVGAFAFASTSLKEIEIPASVTTIGYRAFGYYFDDQADDDVPVDGFAIYGYAETEAETYADDNGFIFHDNTVYLSQDGLWKYSIRPDGAAMLYSDVFQGYSYQGDDTVVTIPSTIDGYTVKELGAFSMSGLTNVTKITVPDSVESIGFSAFSGCTNLRELVLGNNITEIGAQTIDNTAIPFVDGAVYCNGYLLRVDQNYEGTFTVKPGTKLMAMFSFGNCNKIERVILPDSINKIDFATFVGCTSLKEILIPHSVGFIYGGAFTDYNEQTGQQERSLERIYGSPNTGAHAFAEQNNIPFVNIEEIIDGDINGDGEVTLPDYQITRDYIAGNDLTIYGIIAGDVNGDGAIDAFDLFEIDKAINANAQPKFTYTVENNLAYINSYTGTDPVMVIPESIDGYRIIELDANAFKNNTLITGAIVSGNVEAIDNYAFSGCSNLERIDFASGLKSIKYGSFLNCAKLDNVILPDTVTSIGSYAFKGCTSLTSIEIPSSVTTIQATAFDSCPNLTIYGTAGSYAQTFANS